MTWKDIKDYSETMEMDLGPDEISMLMAMDVVFSEAMNREIAAYLKRASDK